MPGKINILHISRTSKITGPENIFTDILERLDRERFSFTVILPDDRGEFYKKLKSRNIDVVVRSMPFLRTTRNPFLMLWFIINIITINLSLFSLIRKKRIDIIECNTIHELAYVFIPLKLLRKRLILFYKNILDKRWKKKIRVWLSDLFAHCIIAVSHRTLEDYMLFSSRRMQSRKIIEVIHDGVNCVSLCMDSAESLKRKDDEFIILNIGNLTELKGQMLLLEAVNSDRVRDLDIKVFMIGDVYHASEISYKEKIKEYITSHKLQDKVIMTGHKKNIGAYLKKADMLIHCPVKEDAFPRVILEAFCFGRVVLATKIGGIPEIIRDGYNGFLCRVDKYKLAEKIMYIYTNRNKMDQITVNARRSVKEDFSVKKQADEMEKIYNRVSDKRKN